MKRLLFIMLVVACLVSTTGFGSVSAAENNPQHSSTLVAQGKIKLHVDCSQVPDNDLARAMMKKYNLCGQTGGQIEPDNSIPDDCGVLSLYVYNSGNGYMQWNGEITSSLGAFTYASYSGTWHNLYTGYNGPVSRSTGVTLTSDWLDIFPIYTGSGLVRGEITSAFAQIFWGLPCYGSGAYDYTTVQ